MIIRECDGITIRLLKIVGFATFAAFVLTSCNQLKSTKSAKDTAALTEKMKRIQTEMVRQVQDPMDKAAIESGTIVVDIKGLDGSFVGVSVPNRFTGKRIFVFFTREHFDQNAITVLAREGLVNFNRALASSK